MLRYQKIGCIVDEKSAAATSTYQELIQHYTFVSDIRESDLIIAIGGDGLMLRVLHQFMHSNIPIYGINRGSIGFLLNEYEPHILMQKLNNTVEFRLYPLEMVAETIHGDVIKELAINEVSLLRQNNQAAKIKLLIDKEERIDCLVSDGLIVSTPAGSTAYNFAANGPIIPLGSNILAITPISPFRPRRWRGALLSHKNIVECITIEPFNRPISAVADFHETRDISKIKIFQREDIFIRLLFDADNHIQHRIMAEQFTAHN